MQSKNKVQITFTFVFQVINPLIKHFFKHLLKFDLQTTESSPSSLFVQIQFLPGISVEKIEFVVIRYDVFPGRQKMLHSNIFLLWFFFHMSAMFQVDKEGSVSGGFVPVVQKCP